MSLCNQHGPYFHRETSGVVSSPNKKFDNVHVVNIPQQSPSVLDRVQIRHVHKEEVDSNTLERTVESPHSLMVLKIDPNYGKIDLEIYAKYVSWTGHNYFSQGVNYYRLLAYLSSQLPPGSLVVDLGTNLGHSAIALASNSSIKVLTYDIVDLVPKSVISSYRALSNIQSIIADGCKDVEHYLEAKLIFLDVDPHDGIQESNFFALLTKQKFRGIVVLDDIHHPPMKPFWNSITQKKYDISYYGHGTGTGLAVFDPTQIDVKIS